MALHLVIDGYNLIGASKAPSPARLDLEGTRDALIKKLAAYKRLKGHRITVVFDGTQSGSFYRARMNQEGIEVIFSKDGEEADHILKEMAKEERHGMTLVTSDRAVAAFADAHGVVTIPSDEFDQIFSTALYFNMKGVMDEEEEDNISTKKSGNPRKPSKKERKRLQKMKKL